MPEVTVVTARGGKSSSRPFFWGFFPHIQVQRNYESHGVLIMNPEDTLVPPGRGDLSGEGRSSSPVHGALATHRGLTRQSPSSPLGSPTRPLGRLQSLGRDLTLGIFFVSFLGVGFGGETSRRERYCVMSSTPSSLFWFFSKNLLNNEIHTIKKYFVLTVELRMQCVNCIGH